MAIHDVAPDTFDEVRYLAGELDRLAVRPRVFKVIPERLLECRELVRFLRKEQDAGSEIVQHGFVHRRHGRLRGPWRRHVGIGRRWRYKTGLPRLTESGPPCRPG